MCTCPPEDCREKENGTRNSFGKQKRVDRGVWLIVTAMDHQRRIAGCRQEIPGVMPFAGLIVQEAWMFAQVRHPHHLRGGVQVRLDPGRRPESGLERMDVPRGSLAVAARWCERRGWRPKRCGMPGMTDLDANGAERRPSPDQPNETNPSRSSATSMSRTRAATVGNRASSGHSQASVSMPRS